MRDIGFSTGALARSDFRAALSMLANKPVTAVELSALRQSELAPLVQHLAELDLSAFRYVAFHAPSSIEPDFETQALELLGHVHQRGWPIVVHPNVIQRVELWRPLGRSLCIENMDKRKPIGRSAAELARIFDQLPDASFCLDMGHARQIDPTMSEAAAIIEAFGHRLVQLHVSEVNTQCQHDALTYEAALAFRRLAHLIPHDIPVILESRVRSTEIATEVERALMALSPTPELAAAGD